MYQYYSPKNILIFLPDPNNNLKPGLASLINTKKFKNNDSLRVENYYIRNQSLIFDIEIILKSLFRV